mgnify:CR=1 FL=1
MQLGNTASYPLVFKLRRRIKSGGNEREREYYERSHKFHLDTGWTWSHAKYDYDTGKPRVDDKENGKERE